MANPFLPRSIREFYGDDGLAQLRNMDLVRPVEAEIVDFDRPLDRRLDVLARVDPSLAGLGAPSGWGVKEWILFGAAIVLFIVIRARVRSGAITSFGDLGKTLIEHGTTAADAYGKAETAARRARDLAVEGECGTALDHLRKAHASIGAAEAHAGSAKASVRSEKSAADSAAKIAAASFRAVCLVRR